MSKPTTTKPSKSPTQPSPNPKPSSLPSHLAMVELKTRILSSLSKLSDRDTHHLALDDLHSLIRSLPSPPDSSLPLLLSSLLHDPPINVASPSSSPLVARRESLRLLAALAAAHPAAAAPHLPKILAHLVKRLKDPASDSSVRDACKDAAGLLSTLYLGNSSDGSAASVVGLFVKPLFEVMGEQNKTVQGGAAVCLAKVVECGGGGAGVLFQKLCPRVCKLLGGQSFLAKAALLSVVSSLSQVGAISVQNMPTVLRSIHDCLENSEWATRKAAADTLCVLATHSSSLVADGAAPTIAALESCRFDKVKPVRDSMMEALQLWKKITGKGEDQTPEDPKDSKNCESTDAEEKLEHKKSNPSSRRPESVKDSSAGSSPTGSDSVSRGKGSNILEKAAVLLKKKAPLTDKELNPEFFQKLETRNTDDLPVEVVVPRSFQSSNSHGEEPDLTDGDSRGASKHNGAYSMLQNGDEYARDKLAEQRVFGLKDSKARALDVDDKVEPSQKDPSTVRPGVSRTDAHAEGSFMNNKGNWLAIQRQLSQLERQQANLMNMLQDFMGGSHDSMVTLENRVRGLERVVEEMARDLAVSSGRRGGNMMMGFEGSPGRSSNKYNGLHEYSSKFGRGGDSRIPFAERFFSPGSIVSGVRGREPPWRSDSEAWDSYGNTASRNGLMNSRRGLGAASVDGRLSRTEHDSDIGSRRAWDKGQGPFRLGEGPSARSVWQASKDEATLEAIRVAGEDNGTSRMAPRGAVAELDGEALTDDNSGQDKGPLWASWTRAMDALHVGNIDSAYAEVLSTGDDVLLVKLMERSGPVVDQLSNEIASDMLHVVGQFLPEQSLSDIALCWVQQLADLVVENGADFLGIPLEGKREILWSLHEASAMDPPEDWEGAPVDQIMMQLASAWEINIQQLIK